MQLPLSNAVEAPLWGNAGRRPPWRRCTHTVKLFSTSCETIFLGWDRPLLPQAVEQLRDRFVRADQWNLGSLICVLPTSHSVDRLGALLGRTARMLGLELCLPEIITVGSLPEQLYAAPRNLALEFEQSLAWAQVLSATHPDQLRVLIPQSPEPHRIGAWMELAGTIRRLHEELAASQLTFADVAEVSETEAEQRRWKLLSGLFDKYLSQLAAAGLADPHWERQLAVLHNRCRTEKHLVLIGVSDMSDALIQMLRSLECDLTAMVAAPPEEFARFDEFGCVDTPSWIAHELPLRDDQLLAAGDVSDQASCVAETIADFAQAHSADEVTVGVTDETQVGPVEIELRGCGVSTHRHLGWTVAATAIGRLLNLAATHLQRQTWQTLAAMIRHADVHAMIGRQLADSQVATETDWLTELDSLLADHYPIRLADPLPEVAIGRYPLAGQVKAIVDNWLADFAADDTKAIAQWSGSVLVWLQQVYGEFDRADPKPTRTYRALDSLHRLLRRFSELNDHLDLPVSGTTAIEMIASRLVDLRVAQTAGPEDVEILGWLDLALDDAPALVVVGLNHPFVPAAVTSDPFLPGTIRSELRMADNRRRYARDVYALHLMLSSRTSIRFIVGRTAADGSPTPPSRLLSASRPADSARRVRRLLTRRREPVSVHHRWDQGPQHALIPIPGLPIPDQPGELVTRMSVTAFRDYLMCPYRFFLRHVLKMRLLDDAASELAANQFGDLVHNALELFGKSADKNESAVNKIEASLIQHLHQYAAGQYGDCVSSAVRLQITQAERRLKVVAQRQAQHVDQGWQIYQCEASANPEEHGAGIDVDGKRMGLSGRFDRIDFHPASGRWAILDYKTHGHKPEKKHLKRSDDGEQWIDLQLPLYRLMIPFLGIDAPPEEVELGYFNISEKEEETRINIAEFSEQQMKDAESLIRDCIRAIWAGKFEPTKDHVPFDDYAMILQTGIAHRLLDSADLAMGQEVEV